MATKALKIIGLLAIVAAAFAGGYIYKAVKGGATASGGNAGRKVLYWVDPMHPAYKSDKPGIAPDCGMKLEPVYAGEATPAATGGDHSRHAEGATELPMGTIKISPEKQQLIGIRFGEAQETEGARTIRALGKVALDETRVVRIHPRVEGWIDQVFVDFVGKEVAKEQKLLTVYSPEMFATQQEFLLALKSNEIMRSSPLHSAMQHSNSM